MNVLSVLLPHAGRSALAAALDRAVADDRNPGRLGSS